MCLGKWLVVMYSTYVCSKRAKTCRKNDMVIETVGKSSKQ